MKVFLGRLGTAHCYKFDRPGVSPATVTVHEYNDVLRVMSSARFRLVRAFVRGVEGSPSFH
jgi:hypothetical protein